LLYKCFVQRLTRKQMEGMLKHPDSPYIRGVGFLYLRYNQDPKNLWSWFEPYLLDEEPVSLKQDGRPTTIGRFVRELLTDQKFCDQLLPRIPVPVMKDIDQKLREFDKARGIVSDRDGERRHSEEREGEDSDQRKPKYGSRSPKKENSRDRSNSSERGRDRERRDRDSGRDRDRDRDRNRDRNRDRDRDSDRRRDRRDSERDDRSPPRKKRSRSRSPTPPRRVRPANDSSKRAADLAKLRAIYGSDESSAPSGTASLLQKGNSVTEADTILIGMRKN